MRDELDIRNDNTFELSPLLPEPPIKQVEREESWLRKTWNFFRRCSRWTCLFFILILIIIVLLIVREFLPFGWLEWIPEVKFSNSDPHIFLIVADDLGWQDVSYGGGEYTTQTIDDLTTAGICLNRLYVSDQDASTRASLLSGKYGYRLGLQNGVTIGSQAHIPTDITLLPELLSKHKNYKTHLVGKWSLGYSKWEYTPTERGFDTFFGFYQPWTDYWQYSASGERNGEQFHGWDLWDNKDVYDLKLEDRTYATEFFTDNVVDLIDDHVNGDTPDQPMFVMYTPPNPHTPIDYHVSSDECEDIELSIRKKFCNSVQALDTSLEKLVTKLKEQNMWDRSLIIFLSDNGGSPCYDVGDDDSCSGSVNMPLRGGRSTLFEGGVRVRAFLSGGYIPESKRGTTVETLVHATDLFPTILAAANVTQEIINEYNVDGVDQYSYLLKDDSSSTTPRDQLVIEALKDENGNLIKGGIIVGNYKYILQSTEEYDGWWSTPTDEDQVLPSSAEPSNKVYMNSDDITVVNEEYHAYLFDITLDPSEKTNLYNSYTETALEMHELLSAIVNGDDYVTPQDSAMHESASPNNFGGIWYPFEEQY